MSHDDVLARVLYAIFDVLRHIDKKLDCLGTNQTAAEKEATILRLNQDAASLNSVSEKLDEATKKLSSES